MKNRTREAILEELYFVLYKVTDIIEYNVFRDVIRFARHGEPELAYELLIWVIAESGQQIDRDIIDVIESLRLDLQIDDLHEPKYKIIMEMRE